MNFKLPLFITDNEDVNKAFRIALSDIVANIVIRKEGALETPEEVIYAGMGYDKPWTRDAAFNVWNSCGLIFPEISKNTLLSVLIEDEYGVRAGGEYWDAVIWVTGAWYYYLYTMDAEFLEFAYTVSGNILRYFEDTEFDEKLNLFRGPACYGDGVAAYPDIYSKSGESGIVTFVKAFPEYKAQKGEGCPMHTLSTNCLYYSAYSIMEQMENALNIPVNESYVKKAKKLKETINNMFWMEDKGYYRYIVDDFGNCEHQEGMGHSLALIFGVADDIKIKRILENQYITDEGIPCVWPSFKRYLDFGNGEYGRHSGTIWPHIEALWADAAFNNGRYDLYYRELNAMTKRALKDGHFAEVYHPITGNIYGGIQERGGKGLSLWKSYPKQTWSASGYIRMLLFGILGIRFENKKMYVNPDSRFDFIELKNITVWGKSVDILFTHGKTYINGVETDRLEYRC